jgi:hypothetical protein
MPNIRNEDRKENKTIRIRPSLNNKLKEMSKKYNIKEIDIITKGIEMYLDYLDKKGEINDTCY